ncbi:MAG TPA: HU family DNA-binding protein [Thermoanaerobaculia bacterium]
MRRIRRVRHVRHVRLRGGLRARFLIRSRKPITDGPTRRRETTMAPAGAMTKAELVDEVAGMTQLSKKHAEIVVNTVFESIVDSLRSGEKIELRGFGSFRIRSRGARVGRNPKTGARVEVPAKLIPYFKPGKDLKELLNC